MNKENNSRNVIEIKRGKIILFLGPMFGGKTSALLH